MEIFNRDHSFPAKGALLGLPPQAISTKKRIGNGRRIVWTLLRR